MANESQLIQRLNAIEEALNYTKKEIKNISNKMESDFFNLTQEIQYVKLQADAKEPFKKHNGDAGYDLYAYLQDKNKLVIEPYSSAKIATGIAISLNDYSVGLIHDRSSMASKQLITVGGVIDEPYTGEISIILINLSKEAQTINHGDKIAQLLIQPIVKINFLEVKELKQTDRGANGFGSTGK